jgi:hypothetical protein
VIIRLSHILPLSQADALRKSSTILSCMQDDVPTTFPTDTIIHLAAMALVKQGRAALHPDIVAGVLKTWLPWVREDLKLLSDSSSTTQVCPFFLFLKIVCILAKTNVSDITLAIHRLHRWISRSGARDAGGKPSTSTRCLKREWNSAGVARVPSTEKC